MGIISTLCRNFIPKTNFPAIKRTIVKLLAIGQTTCKPPGVVREDAHCILSTKLIFAVLSKPKLTYLQNSETVLF